MFPRQNEKLSSLSIGFLSRSKKLFTQNKHFIEVYIDLCNANANIHKLAASTASQHAA